MSEKPKIYTRAEMEAILKDPSRVKVLMEDPNWRFQFGIMGHPLEQRTNEINEYLKTFEPKTNVEKSDVTNKILNPVPAAKRIKKKKTVKDWIYEKLFGETPNPTANESWATPLLTPDAKKFSEGFKGKK